MNAFDVLAGLPAEVYAGDVVKWRNASLLSDYGVSAYTVKYVFREPVSDTTAEAAGTVVGTEFQFTLPTLTAGTWRFSVEVTQTSDSRVITVADGYLQVRAKPGTADEQSHAEKVLGYVQAEIEARAQKSHTEYTISVNGSSRTLKYVAIEELLNMERRYLDRVNAERRARSGKSPIKTTKVRFC